MPAPTIKEAIKQSIQTAGSALTAQQIHDSIVANKLYVFKTSSSLGVVQTQLRRNTAGIKSSSGPQEKSFKRDANGKYNLAR
jgi:hypothetical protein